MARTVAVAVVSRAACNPPWSKHIRNVSARRAVISRPSKRVRAAREQLNSFGRQGDVKRLELALTRIDEAQRLAGQLDQDANARAAEGRKRSPIWIGQTSVIVDVRKHLIVERRVHISRALATVPGHDAS
jgi:hypothetical protein